MAEILVDRTTDFHNVGEWDYDYFQLPPYTNRITISVLALKSGTLIDIYWYHPYSPTLTTWGDRSLAHTEENVLTKDIVASLSYYTGYYWYWGDGKVKILIIAESIYDVSVSDDVINVVSDIEQDINIEIVDSSDSVFNSNIDIDIDLGTILGDIQLYLSDMNIALSNSLNDINSDVTEILSTNTRLLITEIDSATENISDSILYSSDSISEILSDELYILSEIILDTGSELVNEIDILSDTINKDLSVPITQSIASLGTILKDLPGKHFERFRDFLFEETEGVT